MSEEIVLSWRALQRLKVLPEDFPRAQKTTVKANQVQLTKRKAITTAKDISKNNTAEFHEAMAALKKKYV